MPEATLQGLRCLRCEEAWLPRNRDRLPAVCPRCKSPYWNRPRIRKKRKTEAK